MIPKKYQNSPDNIKQLFAWGDPRKLDKPYSYREWDDYLPQGFSASDIPALLEIIDDVETLDADSTSDNIWVPLYAWRILGQLKSVEAIEPLLSLIDEIEDDDWVFSEVPVVLGMIGKPAISRLSQILVNKQDNVENRIAASTSLAEMVSFYPELREEVIEVFRVYLRAPFKTEYDTNGLLICSLIDIKATELMDEIRGCYTMDCLDQSIPGDLEDVEIALGIRSKRDTPKPNYNELRQKFRRLPELGLNGNPFDGRDLIPETYVRETPKVGRNDPCPCGSGKKYKKCCLNN